MVDENGDSSIVTKKSLEKKIESFCDKHKSRLFKILRWIVLVFFVFRGGLGYWTDLKNYIISQELNRTVVEVAVAPEEAKKQDIKKKLFKEKGIIFTDEEIKKYGTTQ